MCRVRCAGAMNSLGAVMIRSHVARMSAISLLALLALAGCQSTVDQQYQNVPVSEWPSQQALRSLHD